MVLLKVDTTSMHGMENIAMINLNTVELQPFSEIIITKSNGVQHRFRSIMKADIPTGYVLIDNDDSRKCRLHLNHKYQVEGVPSSLIVEKNSIIDFSQLNIGGYSSVITQIVREAFVRRKLPLDLRKKLGNKFIRGVILYGPPGTGKKTIITELCRYFKHELKIINRSALLMPLIGTSKEAVRSLFEEAEKDQREKGDESPLHVFICEHMDALFAKRTSNNGRSDTRIGVVNQLLTIMDGMNPLNNILVFGTTNHLEAIEPALFHSGRFDLRIEIDLPTVEERLEILIYHLGRLGTNGFLDSNISVHNLQQLAAATNNYSGADIAGLVNKAKNATILRSFQDTIFDMSKLPLNNHNNIQVGWNELMTAFHQCEQLRRHEEMERRMDAINVKDNSISSM